MEQKNIKINTGFNVLSNLIFYGLGYIFLHLYGRFFIFLILNLILNFFFHHIGTMIALIVVMVDTYMQSKKIYSGQKILPQKNIALTLVAGLFIVLSLVKMFIPGYYFAYSESACDTFYPVNIGSIVSDQKTYSKQTQLRNKCKDMVYDGKTLFASFIKSPAIKNPICENESQWLKTACYFKSAYDKKDYRYCYNMTSSSGFVMCVKNLAVVLKDPTLCQYTNFESVCQADIKNLDNGTCDNIDCQKEESSMTFNYNYDREKCCVDKSYTCAGIWDKAAKEDCYKKYDIKY